MSAFESHTSLVMPPPTLSNQPWVVKWPELVSVQVRKLKISIVNMVLLDYILVGFFIMNISFEKLIKDLN